MEIPNILTKYQFLFTCIKSYCVTWFLIISDHWETKDTENQHCDSGIPCIYHFIGNQDKNRPVCLVVKQQILKFTAYKCGIAFSPFFFAVGPY